MFAKPDCMAACLILKPVTSVGCKMCQNNVLLQSHYIFSNLLMQCVTVLNSLITVQFFQVLQSLTRVLQLPACWEKAKEENERSIFFSFCAFAAIT